MVEMEKQKNKIKENSKVIVTAFVMFHYKVEYQHHLVFILL